MQLALRAAGAPAAELLGRQIDGALEGRANGVPFKHWATPPLSSAWWPSPEADDSGEKVEGNEPRTSKRSSAPAGALAVGF